MVSGLPKQLLNRVQSFLQIKRDGKQDCFHWVIVALIRCRLCVATNRQKELVEMSLVLTPEGAPEFIPPLCGLLNQLDKGRDSAAHAILQSRLLRQQRRGFFWREFELTARPSFNSQDVTSTVFELSKKISSRCLKQG